VKYKRKPEEVEAMQLTDKNRDSVIAWIGQVNTKTKTWDPKNLYIIRNNSSDDLAMPGDYVIKVADNKFEVVPAAIFEVIYEVPKEGGLRK